MKTWLVLLVFSVITLFLSPSLAMAQTNTVGDDHTAREELEGKEVWERLQNKEISCDKLSNNDFGSLGEYFMGQSIGSTERHAAMNQMMISMMGEEGEEQMHVAMGKRLSGCESDAQIPSNGVSFMPMMGWMVGSAFAPESFGGTKGGGNPMMGYGGWNGFGLLGWLPMLLFWILLILGVVVLVRYLGGTTKGSDKKNSLRNS